MNKNDYQVLTETIQKRDALSAELAQLKEELQTTSRAQSLRLQASDLRLARKDKIDSLERAGIENPEKHPFVREIDEKIAANDRGIEEAEADNERLHQRVKEIDAELGALRAGSLQAVLDHQGAMDAAEQEVTKLETLLSEHQARIAAATDYEDTLPALEQRREDLLADIATGDAKESDLKRLDAEIEEASTKTTEKVAKAEEIMERSRPTVSGLEKRLAASVAERDRVAALTPSVLVFALRAESEAAGKEYKRHAERLVNAFERLQGIAQIMYNIDRTSSATFGHSAGSKLLLPLFSLDCFGEAGKRNAVNYFFKAKDGSYLKPAREREEKRLRELGVRLP